MKIIGKGDGTVILQAGDEEVAHLCGYYSKYDYACEVGQVIKIHSMYDQLYKLSNFQSVMKRAQMELKNMAEALEYPLPFDITIE